MAEVNFLVKKGLTVPKGSASTPAIIFDASDPNTGIYSPAADQLAISTNGTGRLFIDASGNVGVASSAPESFGGGHVTFELAGTSTSTGGVFKSCTSDSAGTGSAGKELIIFTDSTGGSINQVTAHSLRFSTANTERLRITSDGKVGLGTSSPDSNLHVASGGNTFLKISTSFASPNTGLYIDTAGDASSPGIFFQKSSSTRGSILYKHNATVASETLEFNVAGGAADLAIDGSGRVGIGTTSPSASSLLDVTSTTQGFLPPRMTGTQRDAISSPAAGLMVYNTTTNKLNFYNGSAWEAVTSA